MPVRVATLPTLIVCLTVSAGCEHLGGGRNDSLVEKGAFSEFTAVDEPDPTDDENDEWSFVGNEARGNQLLERDPDPWWQRFFMSAKARSIERNLGIAQPGE